MRKIRLGAVALALIASAAALPGQDIPSPESVLGHKPGDDFYLANYTESRDYFRKLAAVSNRIKIINVGKTTRGLDWEIAVISSPENLAKLDYYKSISHRLALARGLNDEAARALSRESKVIVHIDGGMHSTEVAGAQQSISLAYKLLSSNNDPEVDAILNNVIVLLWPTLNPDGQNEVVAWYRQNLGTPYEVSPLPDLYQEYVGHDNNRDGYMQNMLESREVTKTELEWDPAIFYCHHQTAPFPTRIFIPPFTEPISSNIHPLMARWLNLLGMEIAAYLDENGMPGAVHRVGFDNWYPGFLDFTHIFRNSISFFTETALYRYATPHFFTVDEFPKDRQQLRSEVLYSSPWKGGWWRLADAVRYMQGASMAVLNNAAKHREELLYNRYQAGRDNILKFQKDPPYAYVIPQTQRDLPAAGVLVEKLLLNGIEVHQAAGTFTANGRDYTNAWVVLMDQPFASLVKELFEPQQYPDLRQAPGGPPIRPYDVAGWTLPMQMGVDVAAVGEPVSAEQRSRLKPIDQATLPPGRVEGTGRFYVLDHASNSAITALNDALNSGASAGFVAARDGQIVLSNVTAARAEQLALKHSLLLKASAQAPAALSSTSKPLVGLYRAWQPAIDEGWTRWILDQYGFHPTTLRNPDIQAGDLISRFSTIILPDSAANAISDGFAPGVVPGMYAGGLGDSGAEALRRFVMSGGTLITLNNASNYAIEALQLPVTNILSKLTDDQFYCSGSLLHLELKDAAHPGLWGLPPEPIVMFERGPAFQPKPGFHGVVLASYPKDRNPLASGYLLHPEIIQGKAAALEVFLGKGRVYLIGFRPQWRGQSHGAYKFLFNAIYDSRTMDQPVPASNSVSDSVITKIHADLTTLLQQNRAFYTAVGPKAVEARAKLADAVDSFQREDIAQVQDAVIGGTAYTRQLRKLSEDLRAKEFDPSIDANALFEKYELTASEQALTGLPPK